MPSQLQMPTYPELMFSVLRAVQAIGDPAPAWKIESAVVKFFDPNGEFMNTHPAKKGKPSPLVERTRRARTYCKSAHLLESPQENVFKLTPGGVKIISRPVEEALHVIAKIEDDMRASQQSRGGSRRAAGLSPSAQQAPAAANPAAESPATAPDAAADAPPSADTPPAADEKTASPANGTPPPADDADSSDTGAQASAWDDQALALPDNEWEKDWKNALLERLRKLPHAGLTSFVLELLKAFELELQDTDERSNQGIDATGSAPISPLLSTSVAVQVAKGAPNESIGRGLVGLFQRDAYRHGAERAVMVTLGQYTENAVLTSRDSRPTVELIDGERLCDMIRDKEIGVRLTPQAIPEYFHHFASP